MLTARRFDEKRGKRLRQLDLRFAAWTDNRRFGHGHLRGDDGTGYRRQLLALATSIQEWGVYQPSEQRPYACGMPATAAIDLLTIGSGRLRLRATGPPTSTCAIASLRRAQRLDPLDPIFAF